MKFITNFEGFYWFDVNGILFNHAKDTYIDFLNSFNLNNKLKTKLT